MKIKQKQLLSFLLLLALISTPAAEAFSLKKALLFPITFPLRFIGDVIFEISECVYLKRTL